MRGTSSIGLVFAEVGGGKGMLILAMTGTAAPLKSAAVLNPEDEEFFFQLEQIHKKWNPYLNTNIYQTQPADSLRLKS